MIDIANVMKKLIEISHIDTFYFINDKNHFTLC